jgi:membrane fusion protein, multidrug efflux system
MPERSTALGASASAFCASFRGVPGSAQRVHWGGGMTQAILEDTAAVPEVGERAPAAATGAATRKRWIGIGAAALGMVGAAVWYQATAGRESTDDAQVDGEIVSVPAKAGGTIAHIYFVENQTVKAGDVLATLDDEAPRARVAQAEAQLASAHAQAEAADADERVAVTNAKGNRAAAQASFSATSADASATTRQVSEADATRASAEASLRQAQLDDERNRKLYQDGAISKAVFDQSETALTVARSNVDAARARLDVLRSSIASASGRAAEASARAQMVADVDSFVAQAHARALAAHAQVATAQAAWDLSALDLSYTRILAPHDGTVSKKTIAEGQAVSAGQAIVQLVTPGVWVTANFKETQIERMHVGEPVTIQVDAFSSHDVRGEIESLSGATGSRFTLLPPDNASGNYTKVVQRLPVRIRVTGVPDAVDLRPGLSVTATVRTRS